MDRLKAIRIISIAVFAGGLFEAAAWVYGYGQFTGFSERFVTMKFSTAVSFMMSGVSIYYMAEAARGEVSMAHVVLPATCLVILLFMATQLASALFQVETGVERLLVREVPAVMSVVPGRPSVVTMIDFILLSATAIAFLYRPNWMPAAAAAAGAFIAATGAAAISGYALGIPFLYYAIPGISGGMAIPTAVLFILTGAALFLMRGIVR